jgi:hypothetical protein
MGVAAGPWHIDDTLTFTVVTHRVDTGALTDADAVPAYRIYEDETGTAIATGTMAKLDDAGTTGFYSEQITLSAGGGFENGKSYSIYVSAAVNSITGGQTFNFKVDVPDVNVTAMAAGVITAASFAANAITAAKLDPDVTTELQAGLATATALATAQTSIDDLPTNAELATALGTADDAVLAQVALVKAKTDLIPSDPADASDIAARFTTLDSAVADLPTNAELATALGTADDAVLTQVALVKAKTDSLTFTVAGKVDANIQAVNDVTVTGTGTTADPWYS